MAIVENLKRAAERVTGWSRPAKDDLPRLVRKRKPATFRFKDEGLIPNHPRWPLVIYRGAVKLPGDFDPHIVLRIVEAAVAAVVGGIDPVLAYDREQNRAFGHAVLDHFDKVLTGFDAVDVEEKPVGIERFVQCIEQPARSTWVVASPIADENLPRHERYSRRGSSALS